jgi:hypothetical protein
MVTIRPVTASKFGEASQSIAGIEGNNPLAIVCTGLVVWDC